MGWTGGDGLAGIAADLKAMTGGRVPVMLSRNLRAAAAPVPAAIRAAIIAIPSEGVWGDHSGLRLRMANCVTLQARTTADEAGVIVFMDTHKMPEGQFSLPAYMQYAEKPWRHPFFGDRERWYGQRAHPYFYGAAAQLLPAASVAVSVTVTQIANDLTGG